MARGTRAGIQMRHTTNPNSATRRQTRITPSSRRGICGCPAQCRASSEFVPLGKQSCGEQPSSIPTTGSGDAGIQEHEVTPEIRLGSCLDLQPLQRRTPPDLPSNLQAPPRRHPGRVGSDRCVMNLVDLGSARRPAANSHSADSALPAARSTRRQSEPEGAVVSICRVCAEIRQTASHATAKTVQSSPRGLRRMDTMRRPDVSLIVLGDELCQVERALTLDTENSREADWHEDLVDADFPM